MILYSLFSGLAMLYLYIHIYMYIYNIHIVKIYSLVKVCLNRLVSPNNKYWQKHFDFWPFEIYPYFGPKLKSHRAPLYRPPLWFSDGTFRVPFKGQTMLSYIYLTFWRCWSAVDQNAPTCCPCGHPITEHIQQWKCCFNKHIKQNNKSVTKKHASFKS